MAQALRQAGAPSESAAILKKVKHNRGGDVALFRAQVLEEAQEGDLQTVEQAFLEVVDRLPRSPQGHAGLVRVRRAMGKGVAEVTRSFREAIAKDPSLVGELGVLAGDAYNILGEHKVALGYLEEVLKLRPNDASSYGKLGDTLATMDPDGKDKGLGQRPFFSKGHGWWDLSLTPNTKLTIET